MRPSGVRRISGWFKTTSTPEETTPFANKLTDNGSIGGAKIESSKPMYDSSDSEKPKMGIVRMLLFILSLNGGVAFVAVLLWAIPCRHPLCLEQQKDWQQNLSSTILTSNIETTKFSGEPYSVVFGYSDESGAHLASLAISNGTLMWNQTSQYYLRYVFCQFDTPLTFNKRQLCVTTADTFIGAFDVSNGETVWQQTMSIPYDKTIHRISLLKDTSKGTTYILGVSDSYLLVVDSRNGSVLLSTALPCSGTIDIKLTGPWKTKNGTLWTLVCEYGDSVEVWTFQEGELLSSKGKNLPDDVGFSLLFSRDSSSGSIDLAGDVTTTPDSLALSWADIVVMVTAQAPFHHLRKTWERRFLGPQGDYLPVTSLVFGHFTDPKETEIAVTVKDGTNMTIHILDTRNGSSVIETDLGMGSVISLEKISGGKDTTDILVLESIPPTAKKVNSSRQPSEQTRSYFTMRYIGKSVMFQSLISSDIYAATLSQFSEGVANLLTASKTPDEQTSLKRLVITSSQGPICNTNNQRNSSTVLILN